MAALSNAACGTALLLPDVNSETVLLHLMQQAWPGGRIGDELAVRDWVTRIGGARRKRAGGYATHTRAYGWRRRPPRLASESLAA
jgi:hypothetical protein